MPLGHSSKPYPLFNFKIKTQDSFNTKFVRKFVNVLKKRSYLDSVTCKGLLINKFVDSTASETDSIFQYKFIKFNSLRIHNNNDDLVVFVSLKKGIQGVYHTFTHKNEFEEIRKWASYLY